MMSDFKNTAGKVFAGGTLRSTASNLDNSGSLYAAGDQYLAVSGTISNSGVIAAQGNTAIAAHSLSSTGTSLLGAGVQANAMLADAGNLRVTTSGDLIAHGENLAAGQATLTGASIDIGASQTSASGIALQANTGTVSTSGATVRATGTLTVTAHKDDQGLTNTHGSLSAAQIQVQVAGLDNRHGTIIQSGLGDSSMVLTSAAGRFDNANGRIAVNGTSLHLGAGTLDNTDGQIEHAGTGALSITAGRLDGERGQVTSNGAVLVGASHLNHDAASMSGRDLNIHADSVTNRGGHLLQSGVGELTLQVAHQIDNAGGEVATDGRLAVQGESIDNRGGRFTSAASAQITSAATLDNSDGVLAATHALTVAAHGLDNAHGTIKAGANALSLSATSLFNSGGTISAGTDLTATIASELHNSGTMYAGRDQVLSVADALTNTGSIAASNNTTITARSVDSGPGALLGAGIGADGRLAQSGMLTVSAAHGLKASGQNLAGGDMSFGGGWVDLGGSESNAANIALTANRGDVSVRQGRVSTEGKLSITANALATQTLDNLQGTLSAGILALNVANLNNDHGTLIQTGSDDTDITLIGAGGTIDNAYGRIATNGRNLVLSAGSVVNADGQIEHAGTGTLAIDAAILDGQRGQITTNGALAITAGEFDHRKASTVAQQVAIAGANLDNRGGHIAQLGAGRTAVAVSGTLDNGGGIIESNGDTTINSTTLKNVEGLVGALGNAAITASSLLDNMEGRIISGGNLNVLAGDVDNSRGGLEAQSGAVALHVSDLNNTAGSVRAGRDLDVTAIDIANSGSLYAGADQRLAASGTINNSGVIAAFGHTSITAQGLSSTATSLLGAGVKTDSTLAQTGELLVITSGNLVAHGQNLAAGRASLLGASVDLSGSQTGAANIDLVATSGNVSTSGATIVADHALVVAARNDGQALVNVDGTLSAGQLAVELANLNNTNGRIIQGGAGDARIVLTSDGGAFDNTNGRIAVNSANLTLGGATLTNIDGHIEHAGNGTLAIAAGNLYGQHGEITGNGSVLISADELDHHTAVIEAQKVIISAHSLDNQHGRITQLGNTQGLVSVSDTLDNRSGKITSNGDTAVAAGTLLNQAGEIKASGDTSLNVTVRDVLDNTEAGLIAAGANATLNANALLNYRGEISAVNALRVNTAGQLQNEQGLLAGGDVSLTASALNNNSGVIAAVLGNVNAVTSGVADNGSGIIQAAQDVALHTRGLINSQAFVYGTAGSIQGRNIEIKTSGSALDNRAGTIAAMAKLDVNSGELRNDAGLLRAGTILTIDTAGEALSNSAAARYGLLQPGRTGGIVSDGAAMLNVGNWYNAGGFFGAAGAVNGNTGNIDNARLDGVGGQIVAGSSLTLATTGLSNRGGQVQAIGDITLSAVNGSIDNHESLIRSDSTLSLAADIIDNRGTQGEERGLEGRDIKLSARIFSNNEGAIRADNNVAVTVLEKIDNVNGMMSAGNVLGVSDPATHRNLVIENTGGMFIGGAKTDIQAATLTGDGKLLSLGDINVNLSGDYVQRASGELAANNNVSIAVAGELVNFGKLRAGATLQVTAHNIDNSANGEIGAGRTIVNTADVLNNRGLIDGVITQVNAGILNNIGAGRLYGDHLSIRAGEINNEAEGGSAATIAARARLDIGATALKNREHALIFSAGGMAIGGALDADRVAVNLADTVTNASATIEALGELTLRARQVSNLNNHFSTELVDVGAPYSYTEYRGISTVDHDRSSSSTRYLAGAPGVSTFYDQNRQFFHLKTPEALWNESWEQFDTTRTIRETVVTNSDPGRIASGGNLTFDASSVLNENSHILAGGRLGIGLNVLNNVATAGQKITSERGSRTLYNRVYLSGNDRTEELVTQFTLPDRIESKALGSTRVEEYTASVGMAVPGVIVTSEVGGATITAGSAEVKIDPSATVMAAPSVSEVGTTTGQGATVAQSAASWSGTTRKLTTVHHQIDAATGAYAGVISSESGPDHASLSAPSGSVTDRTAGDIATAAVGIERIAEAGSSMAQAAYAHPSSVVRVVRTSSPAPTLPNASLYATNPAPSARYLVVTDARFANYRQWLGSEYMLDQLQIDPSVTQKRLGDGYYEQSLIRAQVAQLTGQRYLAGFTSDDEEYRALMDTGVAVARTLNLRPGVALSAAQMAALTDDIVWMVEKEVTLADGSAQKVLVPQVYARVREGDLDGSGALLAGKEVDIRVSGNLVNSGTISGRNTARLAAENVQNLGGQIRADMLSVAAANDLNNIGGVISANSALHATAGRDINVETTTRSGTASNGGNTFSRTNIDQVAGIHVTGDGVGGGTLVLNAGRDVKLAAAQIGNADAKGTTVISAGRNLNLTTVGTASSDSVAWGAKDYRQESVTTEVGSQIQASGGIILKAGVDLNARAADVQAAKSLTAIAGNDINVVAGVNTVKVDEGHQLNKKGFLNSTTIVTRDTLDQSSAIGSSFDGDTVKLVAGKDINVLGSGIAGDGDVSLTAGKGVTIAAATDTSSESHHRTVKEQGFLSGGGGFGISYGTRTTTTDQNRDAAVQSGQARSMVGSISGSLNVNAGDAIKITGSDLSAGKDIDLSGKSVAITAGVDDVNGKFTTKMTQDAITLAIGGSVVNAIQTAQAMKAAGKKTSSTRHQALAAAAAVMTADDTAQDMAKNGPSAKISLTVGHSESESTEVTTSRTHGGSVLAAGNNVTIVATGADKASNIDILGSDVRAANNVSLIADNQVNLLAAQDTESQHSQSKSWSAAVGVAAELSSNSVPKVGYTASVSASRSNIDGEGTTEVNSYVNAGNRLTIASGGDTNLRGAVAAGRQVIADVGGNLNIESLQDTAKLDGKQQSLSASATFGAGAGFSASVSQSKLNNDYASVQEQSGIRAGDGGFQVTVAGNTDLKGGVISSSKQAINDRRNSLATATLSFSDIENRDSTKASGFSLGVNIGKNQSGDTFSPSMTPGMGKVSESQGSVTRSAVSDATLMVGGQQPGQAMANLNREITTGKDTTQVLAKSWKGTQALDEVNAQMQITSTAMPRLAKAIGDYAGVKEKELKNQGNVAEAAKWAEGGIYRVAAHTALGALGGGLSGAVGAAAVAEAAPTVKKLETAVKNRLTDAGLDNNVSDVVAKLVAGGAAGAIGSAVGGSAGAVNGAQCRSK